MKQAAPLHINIPKPCSQNWELMPVADGGGKHCDKCNNIVYDFSEMSDGELLQFFKQEPKTHCGHFHKSQLNREILPAITTKKLLLSKFNKIAAAFFTVLSFKALPSPAGTVNDKLTTELDSNFKSSIQTGTGKVIISGTIKDAEGKPLEKARVLFDTTQVAVTDAEGKYSFELQTVTVTSHLIYFNYEDLIPVVRNYHPAMLSTNYDVVLNKRGEGFHSMGIMLPPSESLGDLPGLKFKKNVFKLSTDNQNTLATIAAKMKAAPGANIVVQAYSDSRRNEYIFQYRVDNIKKYLVEKEGISADRITTNVKVGDGDPNTVDIKPGADI